MNLTTHQHVRQRNQTHTQPPTYHAIKAIPTRAERRNQALVGSAKKATIEADIQAAWDDFDKVSRRLANKHGKKQGWMKAHLTRHRGTKYGQMRHAINGWNAFIHFHSQKINHGKFSIIFARQ